LWSKGVGLYFYNKSEEADVKNGVWGKRRVEKRVEKIFRVGMLRV